jgi:hypothetical protein
MVDVLSYKFVIIRQKWKPEHTYGENMRTNRQILSQLKQESRFNDYKIYHQ